MLLPALSKAKAKASQTQCINNLKQLGLGFMMYVTDFKDVMPAYASNGSGWHQEDWIYWRLPAAAGQEVWNSPVVQLIGLHNPTNLFRCPLDLDGYSRETAYPYSYTLNQQKSIPGIGSRYNGGVFEPYRMNRVLSAATKIMLAEEPTHPATASYADAPNDPAHPAYNNTADDGHWEPPDEPATDGGNNVITTRHRGKGDVTFCDGHVQTADYKFAAQGLNNNPIR